MLNLTLFFLVIFPACTLAQTPFLEILTPSPNSGWSTTGPQLIEWTPPTDQTVNFDIQTENTSGGSDPQFLIQNVSASEGSYAYNPPSPIVGSDEWVMRFIPIANHSAVRAETTFRVKRDDVSRGEMNATPGTVTSILRMGLAVMMPCISLVY